MPRELARLATPAPAPSASRSPSRSPSQTFSRFNLLPLELRFKVWDYSINSIDPDVISAWWDPTHRVFRSRRKPPAVLHCCQESRREGLKTYFLSFAKDREFGRIYFCYNKDVVHFRWETLGASPGRLSRKIGDTDYSNLQHLMIAEPSLLAHADEDLRELERFTSLQLIVVMCDLRIVEEGFIYGREDLLDVFDWLDEEMEDQKETADQTWPTLVCQNPRRDKSAIDVPCSKHWWFGVWNDRVKDKQMAKWPDILAECLQITRTDNTVDAGVLLTLLLSQFAEDYIHYGDL
ncbi:uncharacterized protein BP5553_06009 [Venustampulla echinocandica]|uniref:2EXR domain-containing protein n=1 Tax=Venustampulla echinocandica TaxID=2656787 RepID=A0A370TMA2_9HELO|nr:uncharacterized protein BP5553_06009 [Venustampulla echinocandica]RDL36657.1 hypothetical protein BP5553_06009 [Venustampulla echinocandica]